MIKRVITTLAVGFVGLLLVLLVKIDSTDQSIVSLNSRVDTTTDDLEGLKLVITGTNEPLVGASTLFAQNASVQLNLEVMGSYASVSGNLAFYGEVLPDGATCSNGEILKKTAANNWDCASDDTGSATKAFGWLDMNNSGGTYVSIGSLSFDASHFTFSNTASEGYLRLDWTSGGGPASKSQANTWTQLQTFTLGATSSLNFEVVGYASASLFMGSAFSGNPDCNDSGEKILWSAGLFTCGADAGTVAGSNNQLLSDDGAGGIVSEANLTFDGSLLNLTGRASVSSNFEVGGYASVGGNLILGTNGVEISNDGDGAITFLGRGNGNDENLIMNLDDTTNEITFSSTTNVGALIISNMDLENNNNGSFRMEGSTTGNQSVPPYGFVNDTNTGIWNPTNADIIGFTVGGTNTASISLGLLRLSGMASVSSGIEIGTVSSGAYPLKIQANTTDDIALFEENSGGQTMQLKLDASGNLNFIADDGDYRLTIPDDDSALSLGNIYTGGVCGSDNSGLLDTDTCLDFDGDRFDFQAGNLLFMDFVETTQDIIVINENSGDIDFRWESDVAGDINSLFFEGSSGNIGFGTANLSSKLELVGLASISAGLTVFGDINFGDGELEISNGTGFTFDTIGELYFDTTDFQFQIASAAANTPRVVPTMQKLWSFSIASSAMDLSDGGRIPLPMNRDKFNISEVHCGTDVASSSVRFNISNMAGTYDSEAIIADYDGVADTSIDTNSSYAGFAIPSASLEIVDVSVTNVPDYFSCSIWGLILPE